MEDQLRLFLLLGGTVFIIAVLAHGIWKIRKNSKPSEKERLEPRQWQDDDSDLEADAQEGFDELGIGAVRVVGKAQNQEPHSNASENFANNSAHHDFNEERLHGAATFGEDDDAPDENGESSTLSQHVVSNAEHDDQEGANAEHADNNAGSVGNSATSLDKKDQIEKAPKLYGSVVTNPKPHMKGQARSVDGESSKGASRSDENVTAFPEPPGFLLREGDDEEDNSLVPKGQPEESSQSVSSTNEDNAQGAQSHRQFSEQSSRQHEKPSAEPMRPTQKFYVDPTLEEQTASPQAPVKNQGNVGDFSLDAPEDSISSSESRNEIEQPRRFTRNKRNKTPNRKREEPNFGDDQMRIDFDTSEVDSVGLGDESFSANEADNDSASSTSKPAKSSSIEPEVLVLNVRTPEGEPISGAALLPMLLTLGFKFGDQDIFHRHVNSNGKGPVLFSLANMFKPGVFDIDNLENFETQGISLFMILPIEGDPHQVFNMMHNAARKLADEFGAQVLDGRRSVLTKQGLQQYVEKIREFERKRMIARS